VSCNGIDELAASNEEIRCGVCQQNLFGIIFISLKSLNFAPSSMLSLSSIWMDQAAAATRAFALFPTEMCFLFYAIFFYP